MSSEESEWVGNVVFASPSNWVWILTVAPPIQEVTEKKKTPRRAV